jgi:lipopolysaccharide transport system ATP-binding protein
MYVRLAFAGAAHLDPEILIVDEVLAVGDAEFQKKCLGKMGDVTNEGRTVLFVSHNMKSISELCNSSFLLSEGRLIDSGNSRDVIEKYLSGNVSNSRKIHESEVINRSYIGPMRINSVWLENGEGKESYNFLTFGQIVFCLEIEKLTDNAIIGISVRDIHNQIIIHLSNIDDKYIIKPMTELSTIKVILRNNLLRGGVYRVTYWLGDKTNTLSDRWGDILTFNVDDTYLGQSVSLSPTRFQGEWRLS